MNFKINENSANQILLEVEKKLPRSGMHSFHRYYGKLIPAIPSAFIKKYTKEGDLIFDPFSGSGTTAVESIRNNRNFYGFEINPLSVNIARTKTSNLNVDLLHSTLFIGNVFQRVVESKEFDTFFLGMLHFFEAGRHFGFATTVNDEYLFSTETLSGTA